MTTRPQEEPTDYSQPLNTFAHSHEGILSHLHDFSQLPGLLESANRVREIAEQTMAFFQSAVFAHHIDEEKELFPAVLAKAQPGDEHAKVKVYVDRLVAEHRHIEATWRELEPHLEKIAKGKTDQHLNPDAILRLVKTYEGHAHFEETEFLPLSATILGRDDAAGMGDLGVSLHLRHAVRSARRGMRGS